MRKEIIGHAVLYQGDCREILPTLAAANSIVSDPPYGINLKPNYGSGTRLYPDGRRVEPRVQYEAIEGDQEPFDPRHLLGFAEVLLWGANHYADKLPVGRWLVWDKRGPTIPPRSQADCEFAWINKPGAARIIRHIWDGMVRDSERGDVREHPNQKPAAVMAWCLTFIEGKSIIDPYMGSGTTGVACIAANRPFVGIEIDPAHFDVACRRIEDAQRQGRMFA